MFNIVKLNKGFSIKLCSSSKFLDGQIRWCHQWFFGIVEDGRFVLFLMTCNEFKKKSQPASSGLYGKSSPAWIHTGTHNQGFNRSVKCLDIDCEIDTEALGK